MKTKKLIATVLMASSLSIMVGTSFANQLSATNATTINQSSLHASWLEDLANDWKKSLAEKIGLTGNNFPV